MEKYVVHNIPDEAVPEKVVGEAVEMVVDNTHNQRALANVVAVHLRCPTFPRVHAGVKA